MNFLVLFTLLSFIPPDDPIIEPAPPNLIAVPPVKVVPRAMFSLEDFHIYDEKHNLHGLPLTQKIYVSAPSDEEKRLFIKFGEKLPGFTEFSVIANGMNKDFKGLVLLFDERGNALKALNTCLKEGYRAFPVVIYDDVEMIVPNQVVVSIRPSTRKSDYFKRLNKVAEGKFEITEIDNKTFSITAKEIVNPSNILVLSNLISQDTFWVSWALPAFVPLNGYIWATATIETPSYTNLGQERILKVDISVFDPKIVVKLDLLPQMGPSLYPFPNAGENWLDVKPPQITETVTATKRVISISYPFRYLQFGNFVFQPIAISYEKNGKLMQIGTNTCRFVTKSVIFGTNIEDLQPESYSPNLAMLPAVKPVQTQKEYLGVLAGDAKLIVTGSFGVVGGVLVLFWAASLLPMLTSIFNNNPGEHLWEQLDACLDLDLEEDWHHAYTAISSSLNAVLVRDFGVSLYSLTPEHCTANFSELLAELNKLYMCEEHVEPDFSVLEHSLIEFCRKREI
jgi:hypothetical protein